VAEFDSVIPAGGTGTLTAKIKTTSTQNGPVSKGIAVNTNAAGAERLMLNVRFTAVSAVMVLPRAQINLRGIEGDTPAASLILRRGDGEPIEVTKIDNTDERLIISAEKVDDERQVGRHKTRPGDVILSVTIRPDLEAVTAAGRFRVRTNHPDARPIDVPYGIRLLPLIEARPERVRLILQDGNVQGRTALLRVQHNRRGQFRITEASASEPEIVKVHLIDGDVEQQVHSLAIMLQDEVEPGDLRGRIYETVTLKTDDPAVPEVSIAVNIQERQLRRPVSAQPAQ
jgi:hypothetical protein